VLASFEFTKSTNWRRTWSLSCFCFALTGTTAQLLRLFSWLFSIWTRYQLLAGGQAREPSFNSRRGRRFYMSEKQGEDFFVDPWEKSLQNSLLIESWHSS
jgi:hypothetical protein